MYLAGLELITNLAVIAAAAMEKEAENDAFRAFLRNRESADIDQLVQELDATVTPQIDCLACGNCCRSLMVTVTPEDVTRLATHLHRSDAEVIDQYIETGSDNSHLIINTIPCHFLDKNCCTVYEHRFTVCREFPGLDQPQFTSRLFGVLSHYSICPIIYNVIEEMKQRLGFTR